MTLYRENGQTLCQGRRDTFYGKNGQTLCQGRRDTFYGKNEQTLCQGRRMTFYRENGQTLCQGRHDCDVLRAVKGLKRLSVHAATTVQQQRLKVKSEGVHVQPHPRRDLCPSITALPPGEAVH